MQIKYDRQQEIYPLLREEAVQNASIANPDATSIIPTVGQWLQERIMAPLRPLLEEGQQWLRRFLRFHQIRHPREMGSDDVNASVPLLYNLLIYLMLSNLLSPVSAF